MLLQGGPGHPHPVLKCPRCAGTPNCSLKRTGSSCTRPRTRTYPILDLMSYHFFNFVLGFRGGGWGGAWIAFHFGESGATHTLELGGYTFLLPYSGGSYQYMSDLTHWRPRSSQGACPHCNLERMGDELETAPRQGFFGLHVHSKHGFRIDFQYNTQKCKHSTCNRPTSRDKAEIVHQYLAGECTEGRVVGPLDPWNYHMVHTSSVGVIPKGIS